VKGIIINLTYLGIAWVCRGVGAIFKVVRLRGGVWGAQPPRKWGVKGALPPGKFLRFKL